MESMRLQKWLSRLGLASRREAEDWIKNGRISVNGKQASLGTKVDPENDHITVDGKPIRKEEPSKVYWVLNKPDKVLTSRKPEEGKSTIYDLPKLKSLSLKVASVGRLDYRTEGMLLLSNDGELVHRLTHPKFKIPRHYQVLINGKLTKEQMETITKGVPLKDGMTKKVELVYAHGKNLGATKGSWYFITVYEGRNRIVRRIFEHFDYKVVKLIRYGFGDLRLSEDLAPGDYCQLSSKEIEYLKKSVGLID